MKSDKQKNLMDFSSKTKHFCTYCTLKLKNMRTRFSAAAAAGDKVKLMCTVQLTCTVSVVGSVEKLKNVLKKG